NACRFPPVWPSRRLTAASPAAEMCLQNPVLGRQVLILQQEFLIDRFAASAWITSLCGTRSRCGGFCEVISITTRSRARTLALAKDAPEPRAVDRPENGRVVTIPQVGGLHHRYERRAALASFLIQ